MEVTQTEFNQKMQDVQSILAICGNSLKSTCLKDEDGRVYQAYWQVEGKEHILFRQYWPFTPKVLYKMDDQAIDRIIYADVTR